MKHTFIQQILFSLAICTAFVCLPATTRAMSIYLNEPSQIVHAGDTVIVDVILDTEKQEINVVEGSLTIEGEYEITAITTNSSLFSLWPNKPSFSGKKITFTGGATSGISGSRLKVFSIAIRPTTPGSLNASFDNAFVFLHDGKGTKVSVTGKSSTIDVTQTTGATSNELTEIILADKIAPQNFDVVIGYDKDTYDGKYFASFNAIDLESGINRYEVIENDLPLVRSGNTYILQDQSLSGELTVRAVDNAGNIKSVTVKTSKAASGTSNNQMLWLILNIAVLIIIGIVIYKYSLKKK